VKILSSYGTVSALFVLAGDGALAMRRHMSILVYLGDEGTLAAKLMMEMRKAMPRRSVEVFPSLEALINRLFQLPRDYETVVAVAGLEDLDQLGGAWEICSAARIVLVLTTWDDPTLKKALKLSPSYITPATAGLSDIRLVLEKIEKNRDSDHERTGDPVTRGRI
jgi:hypothetical protein